MGTPLRIPAPEANRAPRFARPVEQPARFAWLCIVLWLGGCATPSHSPQPRSPTVSARPAVVSYALSLRGSPYRWGKESPREGFDCSGFVVHVYGRYGIPLPRTAREMAHALPAVGSHQRQPGDLVFFNTTGKPFSHVGIYVGGDSFVHSSSAKGKVIVSDLHRPFWRKRWLGVRRPETSSRLLSAR